MSQAARSSDSSDSSETSKGKSRWIIWLVVIAGWWLLLAGGFVVYHQSIKWFGQEVQLALRPVDPWDPIRGQYVMLDFDISSIEMDGDALEELDLERGDSVYVVLDVSEGPASVKSVSANQPDSDEVFIRGRIEYIQRDFSSFDSKEQQHQLEISYGLEQFFVEEGRGRELERMIVDTRIAELETDADLQVDPDLPTLYGQVYIDNWGRSVLDTVLVDGEPFK